MGAVKKHYYYVYYLCSMVDFTGWYTEQTVIGNRVYLEALLSSVLSEAGSFTFYNIIWSKTIGM